MSSNKNDILHEVATYYSDKLAQHGETPLGVDWNGFESQNLRFKQLCSIVADSSVFFSLNDLGCGYGALYDYLTDQYTQFSYLGLDVARDMVRSATLRYKNLTNARFACASEPDKVADYGVASGVFNVRLGRSDAEWMEYVQSTLDILNDSSRLGFAFNCLTSYSDPEKMRDYLYYANPVQLFDLCKRRYSKQVALLHDYGLYEFTILVRKVL